MELKLLHIFTSLSVVLVVSSHAALPSVVYWNSKLPSSPMPKIVTHLLQNDKGRKGTGVTVHAKGTNINVVGVGQGGGKGTNVGVSPGGVRLYANHQKGQAYILYAAAQPNDNPDVANMFFLEKDLHQGNSLNMEFVKTENPENLLPRKVADSIPFSSKYTPEIFEKLSVKPESKEAEIIKQTIHECEATGIQGEDKYCPTSLESMIDFSVSKLGKNIQAVSTDAHEQTQKQKYTISIANRINHDDQTVVCHKQNYPYAVFYCHKTGKTEAFSVTLVGENGGKIEAVAVCHKDTSAWNTEHLAFQVLNVKRGTVPVCHFVPENHIVWVHK